MLINSIYNYYLCWSILTVAIKGGLRKSAKEVLEHTDDIKKELDNLVIEENNVKRRLTQAEKADVIEHLDEVAERKKQIIPNGGITKGFSIINPKVMKYWMNFLEKKGVKFEIGTEKAKKILKEERALGIHQRKFINPETNEFEQTIYLYENPSTSTFLEECYHAVQAIEGLPKYIEPIYINGKIYENVDAWEYLAKKKNPWRS